MKTDYLSDTKNFTSPFLDQFKNCFHQLKRFTSPNQLADIQDARSTNGETQEDEKVCE
jgi:hypothetical protein